MKKYLTLTRMSHDHTSCKDFIRDERGNPLLYKEGDNVKAPSIMII